MIELYFMMGIIGALANHYIMSKSDQAWMLSPGARILQALIMVFAWPIAAVVFIIWGNQDNRTA